MEKITTMRNSQGGWTVRWPSENNPGSYEESHFHQAIGDRCRANAMAFAAAQKEYAALKDTVEVWVQDGEVTRPDIFSEPCLMVKIGDESYAESYETLFVEGYLGAIEDLPGMDRIAVATPLRDMVDRLIHEQKEALLKEVVRYSKNLAVYQENGDITEESFGEVIFYLAENGLPYHGANADSSFLTWCGKKDVVFCDNCAEPLESESEQYSWSESPMDFDSGNKGESAIFCNDCNEAARKSK